MSAQEQAELLMSEAEVLADALIVKAVTSSQSQDDEALRHLTLLAASVSDNQLRATSIILALVKRMVALIEEVASVRTP